MASPLDNFTHIGPRTSLYTPPKPVSGQLIIICTWLGAARKHIAKYTTLYRNIAPGARILLIESNVPILISSYEKQREVIKPAVSAVLDTLSECDIYPTPNGKQKDSKASRTAVDGNRDGAIPNDPSKPNPQILLHVFSNGGTNTATQLLIVLNSHLKAPLPLAGLLCDSSPAKGTYWRSYDAMVLSLPKGVATRLLGAVACHCILVLLYTWIAYGNENPASLFRRTLLDEETVRAGWEQSVSEKKVGGRVCYFYSKEDRMCLWSDVREHADEARMLGWDVREVLFQGSGHCAHFSRDEGRYSEAVRSVWDGEESRQGKVEMAKL
ncbi:hypothetical protein P7C71_g6524, partial [Lecanoromycetidae sp. Uapishka_2]